MNIKIFFSFICFLLQIEWKKQKTFLLNEYLAWHDESKHAEIKQFWPPLYIKF